MSRTGLRLAALIVVAIAQLAVPAWMVIGHERTLREGTVFKFRTLPVDPYDAFRGRYVRLSLEPRSVPVENPADWEEFTKAFAVLSLDADGFAVIDRLVRQEPSDLPAVPVVGRRSGGAADDEIFVQWPTLQRYYMTETKAVAADAAYIRYSDPADGDCHVTVRVRGANAVVEQLYVQDIPIEDWVDQQNADEG